MIPANAAPLAIALLGLLLGMRHATDPDHVVAVTTILSRENRIGAAARIGLIWGLGHTITVLIVGAAIIVFKIEIPTRLGLAMEFAVAIVLILLGIGAALRLLRRVARHISSDRLHDADSLALHSHHHSHSDAAHDHTHFHLAPHDHHPVDLASSLSNELDLQAEMAPQAFAARRRPDATARRLYIRGDQESLARQQELLCLARWPPFPPD